MDEAAWYRLAADAMLVVHVGTVLYVVLGLVLTLVGGVRGWRWVHHRVFRGLHLAIIAVIVGQAWAGVICPLTIWENDLREWGGQTRYDRTFVQHWLSQVLFFDLPSWVFVVGYSGFGLLVLGALWWVPVRWRGRAAEGRAGD